MRAGRPLFFRCLRAHVDQVAAPDLPPVARQQCRVGRGFGPETVLRLPAHELPLAETAGEVHPRHEIVGYVRDEAGVVAGRLQGLGDRRLLGRHRLPAGEVDVVPRHRPVLGERVHAPPAVHGAPRRNGRQRLRVGAGEADRLRRQPVQVGRVHGGIAVAAEVGGAQRVGGDHHDVRSRWSGHGTEHPGCGPIRQPARHGAAISLETVRRRRYGHGVPHEVHHGSRRRILSDAQRRQWACDGYLVLKECAAENDGDPAAAPGRPAVPEGNPQQRPCPGRARAWTAATSCPTARSSST